MQAAFGLPLPERGIGLAAHDFYQAFCAPRVYLTRAERVDGTPTVPARWLRRIDALREGLGLADGLRDEEAKLKAWAAALDADRKSVGKGKSASVRVELGGRRTIQKKTQT